MQRTFYPKVVVLILFFFLLGKNLASAQTTKVDSLQRVIVSTKDDTDKVNALGSLANAMGQQGRIAESVLLLVQMKTLCEETGNRYGLGMALTSLGMRYITLGDYATSLQFQLSALKIWGELGQMGHLGGTHYNIATLFARQKRFDEAMLHLQEHQKIAIQRGDSIGMAASFSSIGSIFAQTQRLDSALAYFEKAKAMREWAGDTIGVAGSLDNIGGVYMETGRYAQAEHAFLQGRDINERYDNSLGVGQMMLQLGNLYGKMNRLADAEVTLTAALALGMKIGAKLIVRDTYQSLSELAEMQNNPTEALRYLNLHIAYKDSLMNEETSRQLSQMRTLYEVEKKDAEITLLNSENLRKEAERLAERNKRFLTLAGGIAIVVLLSVGGGWFYTDRRKRHRAELQLAAFEKNLIENDYLRSRLNTHFMKNALQSINGLISSGQHTKAQEYIDRFHRLMQWTLENASSDTVSLSEELEMMEHYLTLEEPCAEDGLSWEVLVADDVDADDVILPPLILQPFLENALLHGLKNTGRPGHLRIAINRMGDEVVCSVEDNGRGLAPDAEAKPRSTGLRLVRERLAMFNPKAVMRMENTGSGTRAEVRLAA